MPLPDRRKGLLDRIKGTKENSDEGALDSRKPAADDSISPETSDGVRPGVGAQIPADVSSFISGSAGTDEEFLSPGEALVDRYEITRFLSKGGMGAVYLARDRHFPNVTKLVAVKEMINTVRDSVTSRISLETFEREANLLASLSHPAIPKVFDYFHQGRRAYLVIEYISGSDLESLLAEVDYPLPEDKVVNWAIQICDVLSYLHNHKPNPIVFRDMKPSNIMLRDDGRVMLIDFGIAKVFQTGKRGTMIGTEGYSPPEQYRGMAEPRGDIYALGATMHHLLSRRDPRREPPFTFDDHSIRKYNPTVTPELEALISKALQYEIVDRYSSAEEMKRDLVKVLTPSDHRSTLLAPTLLKREEEISPLWSFDCEDEVRSSPLIFDNIVYVGSYDHNLYSLDAETGKERWRYSTDGGIVSSPCIWNEMVFFGSEDQVFYAVYTRTGRIVWTCPTSGKIRSSPQQEYGHIFFGSDDHHLYAVRAKSGQELWRFDGGAPMRSSPAIRDDMIVFGCDNGSVYALDVQSGEQKWKYQAGKPVQSSPTVAEGLVYVGSDDFSLYALDLTNGWAIWRYRTRGRVISSPLVVEDVVYVGSNDHHLYALDAETGGLIWKCTTEGAVVSSPRLAEGAIYFGSGDGYLYSIEEKTGNLRWKFETGGAITSSPAIANGVVYASSTDHTIYALATSPSS
jgi:outer membrane protein assembly factor BamB/tRNA A-37 threonylcarbamoyl transferase component Bud32